MNRPKRISYVFMGLLLILVGVLHLATPLLTAMFCYFALSKLSFWNRKWLGMILFVLVLSGTIYGLYAFGRHAYVVLPKIAQSSIPPIIEFFEKHGIDLPTPNSASLKAWAVETVKSKLAGLGTYARSAAVEIVAFVIGLVVSCSLFLSNRYKPALAEGEIGDNLYTATVNEIMERFSSFYSSFGQVMGAQIVISLINTACTSMFLLANDYKNTPLIIVLTFLCGLLPIIGNLISNALIVVMGFTISPETALFALVFLVVLHKMEYFLNSKIVGQRIQNPMWLTLLGLVLGEKLMGIPGMILAPPILHYVKIEMSKNKLVSAPAGTRAGPDA
ncbi:MAG TPA: AI-2E family transporter [Candidatus Limnocylindria bacterium]|nr:AI-2E family transporter [Candidatus Limnocylindria bacterium]